MERKNKKFYLNGKEFRIKGGSFHYFRCLPEYWDGIMKKMRAAGLNTVETYTVWNMHEPKKGVFDFSGMLDLCRFIRIARENSLNVILRTGPFICAEWENGGLPSWLLKKEYNVKLRCNTPEYMKHLKDWFSVLLPKIRPYLDTNGGNVIALAIENEYGSFGDDFSYLSEIEKIYKENGIDCLLFAADGHSKYYLSTGKSSPEILSGTDFAGDGSIDKFQDVELYDRSSPYFASEYWAGNFTDWGFSECTHIDNDVVKGAIESFDKLGASYNIYMMFGGTNFGFTNGAQCNNSKGYMPVMTSYDYDAAISEWGGYTQRYFDIKGDDKTPVPPSPSIQNIGKVSLTESALLWDNLSIGRKYKSVTIEPMEEFDQSCGYILYRKVIDYDADINCIKLKGIADRAHVFLNGKLTGIRMRDRDTSAVILENTLKPGDTVDIFVENLGRVCYGEETYLGDRKGITEAVVFTQAFPDGSIRFPGKVGFNWKVITLEMNDISGVSYKNGLPESFPAFFKGRFKAKNNDSCFLHFDNFKKGVVWINGFNIGRYWEIGPATALYIPGALLKDENEIVIFETDSLRGEPSVTLTDVCGIPNHHEEIKV